MLQNMARRDRAGSTKTTAIISIPSASTNIIILLFILIATISAHANDTHTVFTEGDTWTCFGDAFECSGFMGFFESIAPNNGAGLTVPAGTSIAVGQTAEYIITVRNTGQTSDSYSVSVSGSGANAILNTTTTGIIPIGANETVLLTVNPSTAGNYTTTINAVSIGDQSKVAQESIITTVVSSPTIVSTILSPRYPIIGQDVTLGLSTVNAVNGSITISLPDSTQTIITTTSMQNITYAPTMAGVHNITFNAYGAYNDSSNTTDSFIAFAPSTFSMQIVNVNETGMNSTITIMYNNTVIENRTVTNGNYTNDTLNTTLDIRVTGYNDGVTVFMNGIDPNAETGKTFSIDNPTLPEFVIAYAFDSNHTFTNADVTVRYDGENYDDDRYLTFHVCHDYNFTNRTCNTAFSDITANSTQDFTRGAFTTTVTGFSAFAVRQETNEEDAPPSTSGGCSYRIECNPWPDTCEDGMRKRSCAYVTACDGSRKVYEEARRCGVDERPPTITPLQMVGFIDLADSEVETGGTVRIKINVQTPDDNAAVAFIYEIDGQDVAQDVREERIIDTIGSFYASIDIGDLPPGKYNLTVKARYNGEQTMLKEQFSIVGRTTEVESAYLAEDTSRPTTEQPSALETDGASESQVTGSKGIMQEISSAIHTIMTIIITPIQTLSKRITNASSHMHLALSIAMLMPVLYLIVRTGRARVKRTRAARPAHDAEQKQDAGQLRDTKQTGETSPPITTQQPLAQSTAQSPVQPSAQSPIVQLSSTPAASDRHTSFALNSIPEIMIPESAEQLPAAPDTTTTASDTAASIAAPITMQSEAINETTPSALQAVEHIQSLCSQIVACDGFSDAHKTYTALREQYAMLPEAAQSRVHNDILRAQEHIETIYFRDALNNLERLLETDVHAALEMYRTLSSDADRMPPEIFSRLVDLSHRFAQRVGLKGV